MTQRISYQEVTKGLWDGLFKTEMYLKKSGLDHKLQELVKYRVSQINSWNRINKAFRTTPGEYKVGQFN